MRFRPCIDIHEGKVKQIVGSSISDNSVLENFVSTKDAEYYANLFKKDSLKGGHVIKLCKSKRLKRKQKGLESLSFGNANRRRH